MRTRPARKHPLRATCKVRTKSMRYHVFATDYDGTIAHHGMVSQSTLDSLYRLRESGRRIVLVTGRELEDLRQVFPEEQVFDWIVAEKWALIYSPATK